MQSDTPVNTSAPGDDDHKLTVESAQTEAVVTDEQVPPTDAGTRKSALKRHIGKRGKILLIAVLTIILGLGAAGVYYMSRDGIKASQATNASLAAQQTETPQPATNSLPEKTISISGNSYLPTAKQLSDLNMFKNLESFFGQSCTSENVCEPAVAASDVRYYQVGTTKNSDEINIVVYPGGLGDTFYIFVGTKGAYRVLVDDEITLKDALRPGFTTDIQTTISDLSFPKTLEIDGDTFEQTGYSEPLVDGMNAMNGTWDSVTANRTKLKAEGIYDYYRVVEKDEANFSIIGMYGAIKSIWSGLYRPSFMGLQSEKPQGISWTSGDNNKTHYFSGGMGCGTTGYVIAKNVDKNDLKQVGQLDGKPLYQLPTSHPLVQELYTKDYDATGEYTEDKSLAKLTIQQFSDNHAYVLGENGAGEFVLLQRDDVFIRGGCAKPVVYLYPTNPTLVNMQVGATVVESIPLYETNGWQGVLAQPNGTLLYRGGVYGSLFWDGYGYGSYPTVSTGTVVPTHTAAGTMRAQLVQQGLQRQEVEDFMAYWQPKLPNKPYTRISWLSKAQIDRLAPLHVAPAPSTVIRVFVDFEGLDEPLVLEPQALSRQPRRGFTVVEWGGLARTGL